MGSGGKYGDHVITSSFLSNPLMVNRGDTVDLTCGVNATIYRHVRRCWCTWAQLISKVEEAPHGTTPLVNPQCVN